MKSARFSLASVLVAVLVLALSSTAQLTTNNAQSACVELGGCSTAQGTQKTETQNAPVTAPAGTPALATYTTLDSGFISSLAAAGATSAFLANGGSAGGNGGASAARQTASSAIGNLGGLGGSSGSAKATASSVSNAASPALLNTAALANLAVLALGVFAGAAALL